MNALTDETMERLVECVRAANEDAATRVIVVTGEGPHFCAGGDLKFEADLAASDAPKLMRTSQQLSQELRTSPKPSIGAIRGYCVGGGHELMLHLDAVIASETAKFAQPETRWGLVPFWGAPQLLPAIVGERKAREMLLWGRMYDADQALEMGLCNMVVPDEQLEDEVQRWADELAVRSEIATHLVKVSLNAAVDSHRAAAEHQALLVTMSAADSRRAEEAARFFEVGGSRRPNPARPRRITTAEVTYP